MVPNNLIELAREYCIYYHGDQFRKGSNLPFHTHPINVAEILEKYGYSDPVIQCIALLHDVIEDTAARMDEIQKVFGYEISNGIYILSKNKGKIREGKRLTHEEYLLRLSFARNKIKRVKIADVIDNTKTLVILSAEGIKEKIKDSEEFYIPLGQEICPLMIRELIENIENYRKKINLIS